MIIKLEQTARDLTADEIQRATGIPVRTIGRIRSGKGVITVEDANKIAAAFDLTLEHLLLEARRRYPQAFRN